MSGRNFGKRHTRWTNKRPRNNRATKDERQKELEAPSKNTNLEIWHNIGNHYWNKLLLSLEKNFHEEIDLESYHKERFLVP
jgi:hypothetical protein